MSYENGFGGALKSEVGLDAVPDEVLMARVGKADTGAFRELMDRHLDRSLGFAERVLGSRGEAEDVLQDAFLRVWTAAGRWQAEGARFTTWFYRVVLNLCIDRKRKFKRRGASLEAVPEPVDPSPGADHGVFAAQCGRNLAAALARLPLRQRAAISLCYYRGLSNREAAAVLAVSVKAVESLLSRGRKALHRDLADRWHEMLGDL